MICYKNIVDISFFNVKTSLEIIQQKMKIKEDDLEIIDILLFLIWVVYFLWFVMEPMELCQIKTCLMVAQLF